MSERQANLDAVHGVAGDMTQRADRKDRALLEGEAARRGIIKAGERMSSESAHRLAAEIARDSDARRRR